MQPAGNSYTGKTVVNGGTLVIADETGLGNNPGAATPDQLTLNGGLLRATASLTLDDSNRGITIGASGGTVSPDTDVTVTVADVITGTGTLSKGGGGTVVLTGNNTFAGSTAINAGVLRLDAGGVIAGTAANVGTAAGAQLHVNGGSLTASASGNVGAGSAGLLVSSGSAAFNAGLTTDLGSSSSYFIGVTGGSLSASSLNMGRMSIIGSQPGSGSTTAGLYVNGGAVNITGNLSMGTASLANSSVSTRIDSGSLTVDGVLTIGLNNSGRWSVADVNGGSLTVNDTTTGISVGGPFAGRALLLVRNGTATAGKITLGQGAVVSESVVNLTGGALYVGSGGMVPGSSGAGHVATVNLAGGTLGAASDWSSGLGITLGHATIKAADVADAARNITLNGALSGNSLTKTGNGVLTLGAANTYTGPTTVSNGTLRVDGAIGAGATAVKAGATLGGSGTIGGAVIVEAGGTLAPGTSIGTLTLDSTLTFAGGSIAHIELGEALAADKVVAAGPVTYGGKLKLERQPGSTLANGVCTLFASAGGYAGGFSQLELVNWPATRRVQPGNLTVDGSITIADNAAPVAQSLTLGVMQGDSATLQIIGGKRSPTDADGDALVVTGVTAPGSGSATFTGSAVTYHATGSAGTHTFNYTVADPFGATDTKTVTVLVSAAGGGANLIPGTLSVSGSHVSLQALGIPHATYRLQFTSSLSAPVVWTDLIGSETAAAANGSLNFDYTHSEALPDLGFFRSQYVSGAP